MYLKVAPLVALSQLLVLVYSNHLSSLIAEKRTQAFREQFESSCDHNENCTFLAIFASEMCVDSSDTPYCQTECKFLIQKLSHAAANLAAVDEALIELPEDCSYKEKPKHSSKKFDDNGEECKKDKNYKVELGLRVAADGKIYIEDTNILQPGGDHESVARNATDPEPNLHIIEPPTSDNVVEAADESHEVSTCSLSETETLRAGEVGTAPCEEGQGGKAIVFCTEFGVLLQSSALCVHPQHAPFQFASRTRGEMRSEPLRGMESLSKHKEHIEKASKVLKNVKEVLSKKKIQEFLPIASKIASVLGPVGVAFQVVLFFIPDGPNKEHEEIMSSLNRLEDNTELILKKLDKMEFLFRKELLNSKITDMIVALQNVEASFKRYAGNPTTGMRQDVYKACNWVSGSTIVEYFLNLFQTRSLTEFAEMYNYHRNEFMDDLGNLAFATSIGAMSAELKCFSMESTVTEKDIKHMANDLEPKIVNITEKIRDFYDLYIPKYAVNKRLQDDVKTLLKEGGRDLAVNIKKYLETNYDFYTFGVIVQMEAERYKFRGVNTNCWVCVGANIPGATYVINYHGSNCIVLYSNIERCHPKEAHDSGNIFIKNYETDYGYNTQQISDRIWWTYGAPSADRSKRTPNRQYSAIALAKNLYIDYTYQSPSNAIGFWFAPLYYKFFYTC